MENLAKKTVTMVIGNTLYVAAQDMNSINIDELKSKAMKATKKKLNVEIVDFGDTIGNILPGTCKKALMEHIIR